MKVLVIGGGGREHAIIWKLNQDRSKSIDLYCAPGNAGIADYAKCVSISATDLESLKKFAIDERIDLTIVGMDDPLIMGIVDVFEEAGLRIFGPKKNAAMIEGSKVFSKEFMKSHGIPTASYETFDNYEKAVIYAQECRYPLVVKANGPALGKGVVICQNIDDAKEQLRAMMLEDRFGESGKQVVLEEFLTGEEVSILAFCDGKTIKPMVSARDHKRAYDGDKGPNTGGMGAVSPNVHYDDKLAKRCMAEIYLPTMEGMLKEGRAFSGVLFFGLILTDEGPKVIEYNCRFGDPETQVVLPRLETDLLSVFLSCVEKKLDQIEIKWKENGTACVVLASKGYPGVYKVGNKIFGLTKLSDRNDLMVFHAGTKKTSDGIITAGGRVLNITGIGYSLQDAIERAYDGVSEVSFEGVHCRMDIGIS